MIVIGRPSVKTLRCFVQDFPKPRHCRDLRDPIDDDLGTSTKITSFEPRKCFRLGDATLGSSCSVKYPGSRRPLLPIPLDHHAEFALAGSWFR